MAKSMFCKRALEQEAEHMSPHSGFSVAWFYNFEPISSPQEVCFPHAKDAKPAVGLSVSLPHSELCQRVR